MSLAKKIKQKTKTAEEIEKEMLATWKEDRCVKKKAEEWLKLEDVLKIFAVQHEKLQELAELLKNRPKGFVGQLLAVHLMKLDKWFEGFKKKFGEMEKEVENHG